MSIQQLKRNLTDIIKPDNSQINNRDIHEEVYDDYFLNALENEKSELWDFYNKFSDIISKPKALSINAGGTAWENFYNSQSKKKSRRRKSF